ncbi:MAG: radical SAM protein [bacterium]
MVQSKRNAKRQFRGGTFQEYAKETLSLERGSVSLKQGASVRVALVYPNAYEVGMASVGFQTVYRLFNEHPDVRCERAFVRDRRFGREVRTLESCERLDRFDLVGFSLSFELDLLNVLDSLMRTGIPVLRCDRSERDPLIFIGGAVAGLNPSPLLPFIDGLQVGEGEEIIFEMAEALSRSKRQGYDREDRLRILSEIESVFIPHLNSDVKRHVVQSIDDHPAYTPVVTPRSHFEDMFIVEVGRGCMRGCLFCAAQKMHHPCRFRSTESILETVTQWNPGSRKVGLEGEGLSDFASLVDLSETLLDMEYGVSFSSIRGDRITPGLISVLDRGNVKSFTIAPEAGSEHLRNRVGKGISDSVLKDAVRLLGESSVELLKLYFLIGLPGETDADVEAIVELVRDMTSLFIVRGRKKRIRLSVNGFVPKPFTEFQWAAMENEKELMRKRKRMRQSFRGLRGVAIAPKSTKEEILQGVLSLGDERVGMAMMDRLKKNIPWKQAVEERGIRVRELLHEERPFEKKLPWDFIRSEISKNRLWERYRNYLN